MKKRKFIYGFVTVLLAINAIVGANIYVNSVSAASEDDPYPNLQVFMAVMESIRRDYVDYSLTFCFVHLFIVYVCVCSLIIATDHQ